MDAAAIAPVLADNKVILVFDMQSGVFMKAISGEEVGTLSLRRTDERSFDKKLSTGESMEKVHRYLKQL